MTVEPYDGVKVCNWLIGRGARQLPQVHGVHVFEVAPGRVVKVPHKQVSTPTARLLAGALGMHFSDLRAALGHPIVNGGKPKRTVQRTGPKGCTKAEVAGRIKEIRRTLAEIEKATSAGVRDSAFYGRVHEHLADATRQADSALSAATKTGAR